MDEYMNLHDLLTAIFQKEPDAIVNVYNGDTIDPDKTIAIVSKEDLADSRFAHLYERKPLKPVQMQNIPVLGIVFHIRTEEETDG